MGNPVMPAGIEGSPGPDRGPPIADVKLRVFGEPNLRLSALLTESVDATMLSYEQVKRAQAKGYRMLAYSGDHISALSASLCTTDARIKELPDEVYRVVRATLKGQLFWYRNPETIKFLMEALALSDEAEVKDIWEERTRRASEVAQIGRATEEAMLTNIDESGNKCAWPGLCRKVKTSPWTGL